MASTGLITAEQLQTVVQAIMNKVLKVETEGAPDVVETNFGDLMITYWRDSGELIFFDTVSGKSTILKVSHDGSRVSSKVATIVDNDFDVDTVYVANLSEPKVIGDDSKYYALPRCLGSERNRALHPLTGGGLILTTRYRAYEHLVYNTTSESSQGINATAKSYMYTTVTGTNIVHFTFEGSASGINEYWLDITFPDTFEPAVTFDDLPGGNKITWTGEGEPDWSTLGGRRIQIHILAGMASYVISAEEDNSEYGGAIEE